MRIINNLLKCVALIFGDIRAGLFIINKHNPRYKWIVLSIVPFIVVWFTLGYYNPNAPMVTILMFLICYSVIVLYCTTSISLVLCMLYFCWSGFQMVLEYFRDVYVYIQDNDNNYNQEQLDDEE